ncbi:MAG: von Willebrand factor type A domain-containing protein [Chitinophagales bacterium]
MTQKQQILAVMAFVCLGGTVFYTLQKQTAQKHLQNYYQLHLQLEGDFVIDQASINNTMASFKVKVEKEKRGEEFLERAENIREFSFHTYKHIDSLQNQMVEESNQKKRIDQKTYKNIAQKIIFQEKALSLLQEQIDSALFLTEFFSLHEYLQIPPPPLIQKFKTDSALLNTSKSTPLQLYFKNLSVAASLASLSGIKQAIQNTERNLIDILFGKIGDTAMRFDRFSPNKLRSPNQNPASSLTLPSHFKGEQYEIIQENNFLNVADQALSTFSIDVDGAAYSNIRRFLNMGTMPPKDAIRIEEIVNYFNYDYPQPKGKRPFHVQHEIAPCPWNSKADLLMIGLQGENISFDQLPAANLVLLIDVSGSMQEENKLPLLKKSIRLLVKQLRPKDRISIVVYAGNSGLVLPPTSAANTSMIFEALENLKAGGSTAGGEGIQLAYKTAQKYFNPHINNRIILATDGDFNVGLDRDEDLVKLIEKKREGGVYLSVLGFGMGNYKDSMMEKISNAGNGNYAYIDNIQEAKKVLQQEIGGTLFTIAKDVKLQVEFNPTQVKSYRLIGYENRLLQSEDFDNDKVDAGDMGVNHTVTAFYEIVRANNKASIPSKALKYQKTEVIQADSLSKEWGTISIRYKHPKEGSSQLFTHVFEAPSTAPKPSSNFVFATAVIEYGLWLRDSQYKGTTSLDGVIHLAKSVNIGKDKYKKEFLGLLEKSRLMASFEEAY